MGAVFGFSWLGSGNGDIRVLRPHFTGYHLRLVVIVSRLERAAVKTRRSNRYAARASSRPQMCLGVTSIPGQICALPMKLFHISGPLAVPSDLCTVNALLD